MGVGTYAVYVWSAYIISGAALVATVAVTYAKWHCAKRRLAKIKDSETNL